MSRQAIRQKVAMIIRNGVFYKDPVLVLSEKKGFYICNFVIKVFNDKSVPGRKVLFFNCVAMKDLALYIGKNCKDGDIMSFANLTPSNNMWVDASGTKHNKLSWWVWDIGEAYICSGPDDCYWKKIEEKTDDEK